MLSPELSRNSSEGPAPFRGGSITPDGLIDEDFEEEIGQPVVGSLYCVYSDVRQAKVQ